uniref:INCENP_ARK-bind domain-containing protein n=1 Tax=Elaeophora elaphi TaxID=1147741 RepID=A0A0R3RJ83_9BILA
LQNFQDDKTALQKLVLNTAKDETKKTVTSINATNRPTSALSTASSNLGLKNDKAAFRKSVLNMAKDETKRTDTPTSATSKSASTESSRPTSALSTASSNSGQKEDKSALRKSVMNMTKDEAIKARALEQATNSLTLQEKSKRNARKSGIVNALSAKFNSQEAESNTFTYKRSRMLTEKNDERPKRTYGPIIKPIINDNFDKQIEEIRLKMKTGDKMLSSQFAELKQGIATVADDARRAILEQKHQELLIESDATLSKVGGNFKKWKENRMAEYQKQLEKQEQEMQRTKVSKMELVKTPTVAQPLTEPRKTVRRLKPSQQEVETISATPDFVTACKTMNSGHFSSNSLGNCASKVAEVPTKLFQSSSATSHQLISPLNAKIFLEEEKKSDSNTGKARKIINYEYFQVLGSTENREIRRYGTRNKTQELMNFAKDKETNDEQESKIYRQICMHRRNRYIRKPFDIDILLGYDKENSFEQFEALFAASGRDKRPIVDKNYKNAKRRRKENKKIWISELRDIDKIYRTSELRDIVNSARI